MLPSPLKYSTSWPMIFTPNAVHPASPSASPGRSHTSGRCWYHCGSYFQLRRGLDLGQRNPAGAGTTVGRSSQSPESSTSSASHH
eukprot:10518020-Heterocapsa_arctica.AAC.1